MNATTKNVNARFGLRASIADRIARTPGTMLIVEGMICMVGALGAGTFVGVALEDSTRGAGMVALFGIGGMGIFVGLGLWVVGVIKLIKDPSRSDRDA